MARAISIKTLFEKTFKTFDFDGIWLDTLGNPEKGGVWIIYGNEKNGKTFFALKLAEYLSKFENVLYISAEEGTRKTFQESCRRANFDAKNPKIKLLDYTEIDEVRQKLNKRQSPRVVFFDNITVYNDELKNGAFRKLMTDYPNTTMIFLAHEEKNEPYTATAKLCKKLSEIIIRIEGMTAIISGRCPGGTLMCDEEKAMLYHGSQIKNKQ